MAAPENKALKDLWTEPPTNPSEFVNKKIAVISTDGRRRDRVDDDPSLFQVSWSLSRPDCPQEALYPRYLGMQIPEQRATHILTIHYIETAGWIAFDKTLEGVTASEYDAFIVPGGSWNPDALRAESKVIGLISEAAKAGKVVAAVCHGP